MIELLHILTTRGVTASTAIRFSSNSNRNNFNYQVRASVQPSALTCGSHWVEALRPICLTGSTPVAFCRLTYPVPDFDQGLSRIIDE